MFDDCGCSERSSLLSKCLIMRRVHGLLKSRSHSFFYDWRAEVSGNAFYIPIPMQPFPHVPRSQHCALSLRSPSNFQIKFPLRAMKISTSHDSCDGIRQPLRSRTTFTNCTLHGTNLKQTVRDGLRNRAQLQRLRLGQFIHDSSTVCRSGVLSVWMSFFY